MSKTIKKKGDNSTEDKKFPLPIYKKEDDIYYRGKEVPLQDDDSHEKSAGGDLDIPGAELDDVNEEIGEEDEENNYYSLGGDDHEDLETDLGD
jgi:hypothetical protein